MKRIVSLAAIVLTLTMALSLAACGEEPGTNENTENDQNQTSSNETGKTVDLAALRTQFVTDYSLTDVLEVETEGLNNLYGITEDMVKNSASFSASSGAAFAQEVVMVEAVDESAAATVAEKLETRLSTIAEQAASYDPDSLARRKSARWSPTASMWGCSSPPTMTTWRPRSRARCPECVFPEHQKRNRLPGNRRTARQHLLENKRLWFFQVYLSCSCF